MTSLHDVFADQVADLLSAERQLIEALPKMAGAASSDELRDAIEMHLKETKGHVARLEQVSDIASLPPSTVECKAMRGLIAEGDEIIGAEGDPVAKDAALIAAAQRVEHYEIAGYGTAKELARQLDLGEASSLLDETLDEESAADRKLTRIATGGFMSSGVNQAAAH
jgi:ferritin-like metal-binding protein YciE